MLDIQNQGPQCTACGCPMRLTAIEPSDTGLDLRTFACPHCKRIQQHIIEITVTEAWLEPKRAVKGHEKPVAYDIHDGCMPPKQG